MAWNRDRQLAEPVENVGASHQGLVEEGGGRGIGRSEERRESERGEEGEERE